MSIILPPNLNLSSVTSASTLDLKVNTTVTAATVTTAGDWTFPGTISSPSLPPVGSIVAYNPGYYTNGANAGFTLVGPGANSAAGVNAFLSANWRVCNGAALNDAGSPIWVGASRFLPNLTDARFLMGSTVTGSIGGSNTMAHTHSYICRVIN